MTFQINVGSHSLNINKGYIKKLDKTDRKTLVEIAKGKQPNASKTNRLEKHLLQIQNATNKPLNLSQRISNYFGISSKKIMQVMQNEFPKNQSQNNFQTTSSQNHGSKSERKISKKTKGIPD